MNTSTDPEDVKSKTTLDEGVYYSHGALHEIFERDADLKRKSDEIHSRPPAKNLDDFLKNKLDMVPVLAACIGCQIF